MNTITQIEAALKAIDQASFQTLINHLLYLKGNTFIGAPGAVVAKKKTSKGSPDAFFINNDKYIFVEVTTKERLGKSKSFLEKLLKDIDHCFNESETKIDRNQIERVILACTETINPAEDKQLRDKVFGYSPQTQLEILNIQNLPLLIYDHSKLAGEYLNIHVIKGDIFTLQEFLLKTDKGLQPSLTNQFIGREAELKNCIETLKINDVLLLSGGAGVGKSKLAIKVLEELSKEDYIPIVIQSSGVSLWDDYQHLFHYGRSHIILFDDANKSLTNLEYLLNKIEAAQSFSAKIIITSRDYVKKHVVATLNSRIFCEIALSEFKDEDIGKIVLNVLPALAYHNDIKRKIVELAKGNARMALMATHSVTPGADMNYLSNPVLLYEKYFKNISEEIGAFSNPIILKSLAIVSFFGVIDRNNQELKATLDIDFGIDWNELWSAIMELHNSEILNVYSDEVVKVSDQVLATYAFYKCFIDTKSAVINYSQWISSFVGKFSQRIKTTLIDVNNTFDYFHLRELVLPHLNEVLKKVKSEDEIYSFYKLFWFYKGHDCLLYLKNWIENLDPEAIPQKLEFSFVHNDHTSASEYFDLLNNFWQHPNELLKPSIELTLAMLEKKASRLPETLKYLHEDFKYSLQDLEHGYPRQNILLDVLLDEELPINKMKLSNGIFLNIAEVLLGWHYTEYGPSKGMAFTICNFDLYKSVELMNLRERILNKVYNLYDENNEQIQKILNKLSRPDGEIDKTIYLDEQPLYNKIISDKLNPKKYSHCKFVRALTKHYKKEGVTYPENWELFINSDIMQLSQFLKPGWEYREDKSIEEAENEKRKEFNDFIRLNDWESIDKLLIDISNLYRQQSNNDMWHIGSAVTDIYRAIAKKSKDDFEKAMRLFFSNRVQFPLMAGCLYNIMGEGIMTGDELFVIMNDYEFEEKAHWLSVLIAALPKDQVNELFLKQLIKMFQSSENHVYISKMIDYLKFENVFERYKKYHPELESHNTITYLTSIVLSKPRRTRRDFGFHFCVECSSYFTEHPQLLKEAYWAQYELDPNFDYNGEELKAVLSSDRFFINESLKCGIIGAGYSENIRLKQVNSGVLWEYDEAEELIEDLLLTILDKTEFLYRVEEDIYSLFQFKNNDEKLIAKIRQFILMLTKKYPANGNMLIVLAEAVYHNHREWFISYFREFLILNKDVELIKEISFGRSESWSGSRVPLIQKKIDFYQDILSMIRSLPNILDYSGHIDYFEQKIAWKKKEILDEQKNDFMEEYYH